MSYPKWAPQVLVNLQQSRRPILDSCSPLQEFIVEEHQRIEKLLTNPAMSCVWSALERRVPADVKASRNLAIINDSWGGLFQSQLSLTTEALASWEYLIVRLISCAAAPIDAIDTVPKVRRSGLFKSMAETANALADAMQQPKGVYSASDMHPDVIGGRLDPTLIQALGCCGRYVSFDEYDLEAGTPPGQSSGESSKASIEVYRVSELLRGLASSWLDEAGHGPLVTSSKADNPQLVAFVRRLHNDIKQLTGRDMYEQIRTLADVEYDCPSLTSDRVRHLCKTHTGGKLPKSPFF